MTSYIPGVIVTAIGLTLLAAVHSDKAFDLLFRRGIEAQYGFDGLGRRHDRETYVQRGRRVFGYFVLLWIGVGVAALVIMGVLI